MFQTLIAPDKGIQETLNPSVPLHDARSHV